MDEDYEFTEEEIRQQLRLLGYSNVPEYRLKQFKEDLDHLVRHEKSKSSSRDFSNVSSFTENSNTDEDGVYSQKYRQPLEDTAARPKHTAYKPPTNSHVRFGKENQTSRKQVYIQSPEYATRTTYKPPPQDERVRYRHAWRETVGDENTDEPEIYDTARLRQDRAPPRSRIESERIQRDRISTHTRTDTDRIQRERVAPPSGRRNTEDTYRRQNHASSPDPTPTVSPTESEKKVVKRKILRKRNGESFVDESVTESEPDELAAIRERLRQLPLREDDEVSETNTDLSSIRAAYRKPHDIWEQAPYELPDDYAGPKSLIRPATAHPHTKNIRKCDPVSRHQKYRQAWASQKAPEEKKHKDLRWKIREQMLYEDEIEKRTHKVYVPNTYMVPGDKKRKALRWKVRNDMAQGVMPSQDYQDSFY